MRLKTSDIDQEVKERAIGCMGQIIANLGDLLAQELPSCLPILLERLKNEITRLTAVKALTRIASSDLKIDLKIILEPTIANLATFLRKNQRALKLSTLALLNILVKNYPMDPKVIAPVMTELPQLLNESDLHIAQLTMDLMTTISQKHKGLVTLMPEIFRLAQSPLLQVITVTIEYLKYTLHDKIIQLIAGSCPQRHDGIVQILGLHKNARLRT